VPQFHANGDHPDPKHAELGEEPFDDVMSRRSEPLPRSRSRPRRSRIDDLVLVDDENSPAFGRNRSDVGTTGASEYVAVFVTQPCGQVMAPEDAEHELQAARVADGALVWDKHEPGRFAVWTRLTKRTLLIPRTALTQVSDRNWGVNGVVLDGSAPATRLFTEYLELLARTATTLSPLALAAARNAALELFIGALRPAALAGVGPPPGEALRAVMESWIARNLRSTNITSAAIAAAHGVSVRTVDRVFGGVTELSAVVRGLRLARARGELSVRAEPISVIARRWGFTNSRQFSEAFRAHYGITPSAYRIGRV
jgi:AraC-like DNA-binding protein